MIQRRAIAAAFVLLLVSVTIAEAGTRIIKEATIGKPVLKSINVMGFAPDGVLLIGDGAGSQVLAIATDDRKKRADFKAKLEGIDKQLAGRLGTTAKGIEIIDLAVNPLSGKVYIAVRKQDDKSYVILTVNGAGKISEFRLDKVAYARVKLSAGESRINRITDLAWADDRLIVAGRSNEEFASKIFSIYAPLKHDTSQGAYSAETYHVSHRRWETKAPMSVVIPFKENGKTYVVGAFSCTPIVKYPIDSIQPGAKVKGTSMIELGSGNRPLDMFVYEKGGKRYVLANTFRFHHKRKPFGPSPYWTVRFEQELLSGDADVNEKAVRRLKGNYQPAIDSIQLIESFHGVMQMDKLDENRAIVLRSSDSVLSLEPLTLP